MAAKQDAVHILRPMILAGGSGTRFCPLSRQTFPKQLSPQFGERSLLQTTISRISGLGWQAEIGLGDGIASTYRWYLESANAA